MSAGLALDRGLQLCQEGKVSQGLPLYARKGTPLTQSDPTLTLGDLDPSLVSAHPRTRITGDRGRPIPHGVWEYLCALAMARLALGDRAGYRKACARMIVLAEATDDREAAQMTALACVLDANIVPKWDAVVRLEASSILEQKFKMIDFMDQWMPHDPKSKIWSDWIYLRSGKPRAADEARSKARALFEQQLATEHHNLTLASELANLLLIGGRAQWTVLKPTEMKSEGGATLTLQDDGSILAQGGNREAEFRYRCGKGRRRSAEKDGRPGRWPHTQPQDRARLMSDRHRHDVR